MAGDSSAGVSFQSSGWDVASIAAFNARGVVDAADDEFGELRLHMRPTGVEWTTLHLLSDPVPSAHIVANVNESRKTSNVDAILSLHRLRWKPGAELVGSWVQGDPMTYCSRLDRPLSYFNALICSAEVIAKGRSSILHGACDGYYKCLLSVPGGPFSALLDGHADDVKNNGW